MRLGFARWVSDVPTGGNTYDAELGAALRRRGVEVAEHRLPGAWPHGTEADRQAFVAVLERERDWLVDGIVACAAPEIVATTVAAGRRLSVLVHMSLPDEEGLDRADRERLAATEATALRAATTVVCTSRWTADRLQRRYGVADARVAVPGVWPADPAPGSPAVQPPRLLALGSITATKNQLTLLDALARVADRPWHAWLVGADRVERDYAASVTARVAAAGLGDRVTVPGPLVGRDLAEVWAGTDLLLLPSRTESYGLVVVEALARGIPSLVSAGTGAVEAQSAGRAAGAPPPGGSVAPGRPAAWAVALRRWLEDPELRRMWRGAALAQRRRLPDWDSTAEAVLSALDHRPRPSLRGAGGEIGEPPPGAAVRR